VGGGKRHGLICACTWCLKAIQPRMGTHPQCCPRLLRLCLLLLLLLSAPHWVLGGVEGGRRGDDNGRACFPRLRHVTGVRRVARKSQAQRNGRFRHSVRASVGEESEEMTGGGGGAAKNGAFRPGRMPTVRNKKQWRRRRVGRQKSAADDGSRLVTMDDGRAEKTQLRLRASSDVEGIRREEGATSRAACTFFVGFAQLRAREGAVDTGAGRPLLLARRRRRSADSSSRERLE
jgi:hypothetical protein